jgi:hypothetical protein
VGTGGGAAARPGAGDVLAHGGVRAFGVTGADRVEDPAVLVDGLR